jgi:hypothetical protein
VKTVGAFSVIVGRSTVSWGNVGIDKKFDKGTSNHMILAGYVIN